MLHRKVPLRKNYKMLIVNEFDKGTDGDYHIINELEFDIEIFFKYRWLKNWRPVIHLECF